jgi:hypothetical protein
MERVDLGLTEFRFYGYYVEWGMWKMVQSLQRLKAGGSSFSMMFILAMEPLHRLLELAHLIGLPSPINKTMAQLRISMYADDVAVFVNPAKEEVQTS